MTRVHTLGPQTTDCYRAAQAYVERHPEHEYQIMLHSSFAAAIAAVTKYPGEQILLPTALQLADGTDWGALHYRYLERWQLVDVFSHPLDPLVLVQSQRQTGFIDLHPATAELARRLVDDQHELRFAASKWAAYQAYRNDGEFCITNQANLDPQERILNRWDVNMVWTVYQEQEE
ncbi:hypothetical protein [Fructilactobacillus cliffordii]|uniref:Uncharacterized protein n=1 Tax=Fructilactobacillus cliffordii TaxID=2940299 RepID=A0A9Q8ZTS6_9LACO|nr:hypothetical protein [Fructilactobacillus cliffordii]USS89147.1 hypothetical protein M3M40_06635 [Fructilactobacillus cliffordii]